MPEVLTLQLLERDQVETDLPSTFMSIVLCEPD